VTKTGFADRTRKTSSLTLPHSDMEMPEQSRPDAAIEFGSPAHAQYRLRLEFDDGFAMRAPQSVTVARDYGDFKATYVVDGRVFSAERTLDIRVGELPAERGSDYAAFRRVIMADAGQRLALEMRGAPVTAVPLDSAGASDAGLNVDELVKRGNELLLASRANEALPLLQRAAELQPRHRLVWLPLASAHVMLRNYDEGAAALQKQIELDPYHDRAYTLLGAVYAAQRRFTEAEAAFKKQLEVNPLDPAPQQALAQLYTEMGRHADAIPLLERAAGEPRAEATDHVSLGNAYLKAGRTDQAVAAFDKAVELSPTPMIWNNVAYHLSEAGQRLDRAQQYAESAVTSASVESRNISLSRLTSREVGIMRSLASYWDTLGWVAFMKGDLSRAEQLLAAAWRLSESVVIGDHLAQIYEKQGRRDLAIRTYAAVAGLGPNQDSATRVRLRTLVKTDAEVTRLEGLHRSDPATMRTVSVKSAGGTGTAVFNILLGTNGVEDVAFASGDEALRGHAANVRAANFKELLPFNDAVPAKLFRQGALACSNNNGNRTECVLVLFPLSGVSVAQGSAAQK
jgi:tetratricopeptide (TPR) repeat protein